MPTANDNQLPFQEGIDYLSNKLNLDTETWIDGQGLTQTVAFTVAGAKGQLLQDIRTAVDLAINDGISIADFAKRFDRIADSYADNWQLKGDRAWRGQLIYSQNLRQAYGAGRYQQMTDPDTVKRRPFWQYRHGDSRVPRPTHLAMDGKVFLADSLSCFPPCGFNCRCQIFSLSQRDIDREGLTVEDVEFEADKGFNYKPGKLTKERRDELLKGLEPDIRKLVEGDTEAEFKLPEGSTRRRNGANQILQNSRWHRADKQDAPGARSRMERASDIYELTQQFEHDMEHGSATYEATAERFLHDLMQHGDRDAAEAQVKSMQINASSEIAKTITTRNAVDFCQLIDKPSGVKSIDYADGERAHATLSKGAIQLDGEDRPDENRVTQFHEMAHHAEYADKAAGKDAEDWVKARATGETKLLSALTGNKRYRDDESALPDDFIDHYVGKLYGNGITEVHSMGLQAFANPIDLVDLYKADPEHFRLMMRYIRK
jgi:Phage Mu protein F like protein